MKFNPFDSVKNHSSDEPIELNADQKSTAIQYINDIFGALVYLKEQIVADKIQVNTRYNSIGIAKYKIQDLHELLGGEDDIKQDEERRNLSLRHANIENARLRDQLGKSVTTQAIASKLNLLKQDFYDFWKNLGFLYSTIQFSSGHDTAYLTCELSCYINNHISSMTQTPVSDKKDLDERIEQLKQKIETDKIPTGLVMIDSEKNRNWVIETLKNRFPSCRIQKIRCCNHKEISYIRKITVMIDILDIGDEHKEFKW